MIIIIIIYCLPFKWITGNPVYYIFITIISRCFHEQLIIILIIVKRSCTVRVNNNNYELSLYMINNGSLSKFCDVPTEDCICKLQ